MRFSRDKRVLTYREQKNTMEFNRVRVKVWVLKLHIKIDSLTKAMFYSNRT